MTGAPGTLPLVQPPTCRGGYRGCERVALEGKRFCGPCLVRSRADALAAYYRRCETWSEEQWAAYRERHKLAQRLTAAERRAAGLCAKCGKRPMREGRKGSRSCQPCFEARRAKAKTKRMRAKLGLDS